LTNREQASEHQQQAFEELQKANEKVDEGSENVYKWMAGFRQEEIGQKLTELDNGTVLKMVEMADQQIRRNKDKSVHFYMTYNPYLLIYI
jgi:hypothetical protein